MSQELGAFGLLDFTILRPVIAWRAFQTYKPFISLIFKFFSGCAVNRGYGDTPSYIRTYILDMYLFA
jgi:hypothetical protein